VSSHPAAFVDESFIDKTGHPGFYLLAAVIVEADNLNTLIAAARTAAAGEEFHTTQAHHRGHHRTIEDMLDTIEHHAAWTTVIAHAPLGPSKEVARQTGLRQLLTHLDKQRVRDVVLDTRGGPSDWQDAWDKGHKRPDIDHRDLRTYRHMVANREISSRLRLLHVDDRDQPGLWLADVAAWAAHRTLNADEPQWWLRIADAATVMEAVTGTELQLISNRAAPPIGERGPHAPGQSAQAVLSPAAYRRSGPAGHPPTPGTRLTHLIEQADRARDGPNVPHQILAAVREVTTSVNELLDALRSGANPIQPATRRSPGAEDALAQVTEPDSGSPFPS
jgi:hypothetical protein